VGVPGVQDLLLGGRDPGLDELADEVVADGYAPFVRVHHAGVRQGLQRRRLVELRHENAQHGEVNGGARHGEDLEHALALGIERRVPGPEDGREPTPPARGATVPDPSGPVLGCELDEVEGYASPRLRDLAQLIVGPAVEDLRHELPGLRRG
jgi:hypothetical protein